MKFDLPVFAKVTNDGGAHNLKIWDGDGVQAVPLPVTIHNYYVDDFLEEGQEDLPARLGITVTKELRKLLSTNKVQRVTKLTYPDKHALEEFTAEIVNDGIRPTKDLINLVVQEDPEFFRQFKGKDLNILYFDIEQFVRKGDGFPTPDKPVIGISYAFNDEEIQHYNMTEFSERDIIHKFATDIVDRDPDIIVGFNQCKYDIPVIEHKFAEFGVPNEIWSRENARPPYHYEKNIGPTTLQCSSVDGRIIYDVYHATSTDQALSGQSRGLKAVAKNYQASINKNETEAAYRIEEIIEEDLGDQGTEYLLKDPPRLRKYNNSDVQLTRALFKFYFTNNKAIAEFVGVPLNKVVPLASTYSFTQILGNILEENKFLADSTNQKRYPYAFETANCYFTDVRDGKEKSQKPYQGAISDCYLPGLYHDHVEDDVGSLYPCLMASLGAGPDNTRIVKTIDFSDKEVLERYNERKKVDEKVYSGSTPAVEYKVEVDGDKRTYYLPDYTRKWTWVVEVDGVSPVAARIKEFLKIRLELKHRAIETGDATLFARAYALKVTLNSCYGIAGSAVIPFGELGVAVLTTLTGQMVLNEGMDFTGREHVTLVDTDSYKVPAAVAKPIEEVNAHFAEWVPRVMKGEPLIIWEREEIPAILCLQPKTYLKLDYDKEGNPYIKKTGGSLKGTKYTNIFNKVLDSVGETYLLKGEDAAREEVMQWLDMEQYDEKDFIMTLRLGKKLDEYKSMTAQAPALAVKFRDQQGVDPYVGMNMRYVVTRDEGFEPVTAYALKNLDKRYYLQIVLDAAARLNLDNIITRDEFMSMTLDERQQRLSDWL